MDHNVHSQWMAEYFKHQIPSQQPIFNDLDPFQFGRYLLPLYPRSWTSYRIHSEAATNSKRSYPITLVVDCKKGLYHKPRRFGPEPSPSDDCLQLFLHQIQIRSCPPHWYSSFLVAEKHGDILWHLTVGFTQHFGKQDFQSNKNENWSCHRLPHRIELSIFAVP